MKPSRVKNFAIAAIAVIATAGCGGANEEPAPAAETPAEASAPAATSTPAPQAAAPADSPAPAAAAPAASGGTGSIAGRAVFEGTAPERATLETDGDPKCHAMHKDAPLLSDREVVGPDNGVRWAFAYIKTPPAGDYPIPAEAADLDQVGCAYTPHVLGVRVGQKLNIKNSDPTLHNVRAIARANKPINFAQPEGSAPRERIFDKPEEIKLKCDIHSWMTGYVFTMEHPFFAVSDETGAFSIPNVPAGDYTLVVWHEAYGKQEIPVSVKAGEAAAASVTFKPMV